MSESHITIDLDYEGANVWLVNSEETLAIPFKNIHKVLLCEDDFKAVIAAAFEKGRSVGYSEGYADILTQDELPW